MSTATGWATNFLGLDDLIAIGDRAVIRATVEAETWVLSAEEQKLQCDADMVLDLGLVLDLPASEGEVLAAIEAASLGAEEVELLLVGEDGFLKEREVLLQRPLVEVIGETVLLAEGEARPRALMNTRSGFSLEMMFISGVGREPAPGRPHQVGSKLFARTFEVKPFADPNGIDPIELTQETIDQNHLAKTTQVFVEFKEGLLESESISDALSVHVDSKLLAAVKARRVGIEYEYLTTNLAVNALQQVVYELSRELAQAGVAGFLDDQPPVLAMAVARLRDVSRAGKGKPTAEEAVRLIAERPEVAASMISSIHSSTQNARKLIRDSGS